MLSINNDNNANDGIRATVLSKKRWVEERNELNQNIMNLEQDKQQARENATAWKETFYLLKKTFQVLQVELSVKWKNDVKRVWRKDKKSMRQMSLTGISDGATAKTAYLYTIALIYVRYRLRRCELKFW